MEDFNHKFDEQKQKLVDMSLKLYKEKLIVGTWGNLSMRIKDEDKEFFLVTPSGMDYEKTEIGDIVVVDKDGNVMEGNRIPTSGLKVHLNIYKNRKDINAIFHIHSTCATACAVAGKEIPILVEDMVQQLGGEVRIAKYALPGTVELANQVVMGLGNRKGVILKSHGAIGVGIDLMDAYISCVLIEKTAKILIYARVLGNINLLSTECMEKIIDYYNNSYGQK